MNIFNFFRKRKDNQLFVELKYGTPNPHKIKEWLDNLPDEVIRRTHRKLMKHSIIIGAFKHIPQSRALISLFAGHEGFAPKVLKCIRAALVEYENP